jgi:hypothetical protein
VHHTLLIPSILAPAVVSLFEASSLKMKYTIVGAAAATALSLALKLELRAYVHTKAAKDYLLLAFDAQHSGSDLRNRIAQLLREAPLLPSCICARETPLENHPMIQQGTKGLKHFRRQEQGLGYTLRDPPRSLKVRSINDVLGVETGGPDGRRLNEPGHSVTD